MVAGAWLGLESTQADAESPAHSQPTQDASASFPENNTPVAWALFSSGDSQIVAKSGATAEQLRPLRPLYMGNTIQVPEGASLSILIPGNMTRRYFDGPASLEVIKDTVSLLKGPKVRVFPADPSRLAMAEAWSQSTGHAVSPASNEFGLTVTSPLDGAVLLTQKPEFHFIGQLPKDGKLIIYNAEGRRFWVSPMESDLVRFPPAAQFKWGQKFTWEVRKSTGGKVLGGAFEIAPEALAFDLMSSKVPNLPHVPREDLLFYGLRLEMARAYREADLVWDALGTKPYR